MVMMVVVFVCQGFSFCWSSCAGIGLEELSVFKQLSESCSWK
jgi:hypothetical protein